MNPFCTITPTRSDRPELLEFCKYQLSRMESKPDKAYFIDYKPESESIDLVARVHKGVHQAKADGYEYVFIVEDDDYYPADYFSTFDIGKYPFYGSEQTTYYNIRNRTYNVFSHPQRSSLFVTGFSIGALDGFNWYAPRSRFLDISLWEFAGREPKQFVQTKAIGIKHNLGLCAGKGHVMRGKDNDDNLEWLKANVDSTAFDFYTGLMKRL